MDLDALTAARRDEWARLDELGRTRRLNGAEVDELVTRYRAASADLADIKSSAGRTPQGDYVSILLARTRLRLTGVRENVLKQLPRFFLLQLPAALYRVRWMTLAVTVFFVAVSTLVAAWISSDPATVAALGGVVLLLNLRLLGCVLRSRPIEELASAAAPWQRRSLALALATGSLLFLSEPMKLYYSEPFWIKISCLALVVAFDFTVRRRATRASAGGFSARLAGLVSLALWSGVAWGGRWIGFSG